MAGHGVAWREHLSPQADLELRSPATVCTTTGTAVYTAGPSLIHTHPNSRHFVPLLRSRQKKGCLPAVSEEKRVPIGLLFVFIVAAGMTIFLHEHHHHRHNKWRGEAQDYDYQCQPVSQPATAPLHPSRNPVAPPPHPQASSATWSMLWVRSPCSHRSRDWPTGRTYGTGAWMGCRMGCGGRSRGRPAGRGRRGIMRRGNRAQLNRQTILCPLLAGANCGLYAGISLVLSASHHPTSHDAHTQALGPGGRDEEPLSCNEGRRRHVATEAFASARSPPWSPPDQPVEDSFRFEPALSNGDLR